jgi:hypothetical protein
MCLSAAEVPNGMHPSLGHCEHSVIKNVTFHAPSQISSFEIEDYVVFEQSRE